MTQQQRDDEQVITKLCIVVCGGQEHAHQEEDLKVTSFWLLQFSMLDPYSGESWRSMPQEASHDAALKSIRRATVCAEVRALWSSCLTECVRIGSSIRCHGGTVLPELRCR